MENHLSWNKVPRINSKKTETITSTQYKLGTLGAPYTVYGLGRSYGDVCLTNEGTLLVSTELNQLMEFDIEKGRIKSEAGMTLDKILQLTTSKGWFIPVVPGTRFIKLSN